MYKTTGSEFNKDLTERFIKTRQKLIEDTMDRLYDKERITINSKQRYQENQNNFKNEIDQWESTVKKMKNQYNDLHHNNQVQRKKDYKLGEVEKDLNDKVNITPPAILSLAIEESKIEEKCTETEIEGALNYKDSQNFIYLRSIDDLLILKKNNEKYKEKIRKIKINNVDAEVELDRLKIMNNKIISMFQKEKNKYTKNNQQKKSESIASLFADTLNNEINLFEDRIILEKIQDHEIKLIEEKKFQINIQKEFNEKKKKLLKENNKKKDIKDKIQLRYKFEKLITKISKIMKKFKVSKPELLNNRIQEMRMAKNGLTDLVSAQNGEKSSIITEISGIKDVLKKKESAQNNYLEGSPTKFGSLLQIEKKKIESVVGGNKFLAEDMLQKKKSIEQWELENKYRNETKIVLNSSATISRILYQLQDCHVNLFFIKLKYNRIKKTVKLIKQILQTTYVIQD